MNWTPKTDSQNSMTGNNNDFAPIFHFILGILLLAFLLTACDGDSTESSSPESPFSSSPDIVIEPGEDPTITPEPSPTTPPPTPTPQLAAMVNGQPILLESYEKELLRYEKAMAELGLTPGEDGQNYRLLVLDALIERELIRQAAQTAGISIPSDMVDTKLADLRQSAGETGGFENWLAANQWTDDEFKEALATEMLVEAMIAEVTADVPFTGEQVRARYIQLDDAELADSLLLQIKEGADFADLAARYSRDSITGPAGGDLGFFARGSLIVPEVEEAAFQLQPEEVSDVLSITDPESGKVTYYIVMVTERDPERPFNTDQRQQLLQERFDSWLKEQRANATILNLLDEG
jgi:peptidyl-prolyl cis-trans isomerase C